MTKQAETEKHRSLNVSPEVYGELEALRRREQEDLGLHELSWNNFFARIAKVLRDEKGRKR
jgi:hypothetical protein